MRKGILETYFLFLLSGINCASGVAEVNIDDVKRFGGVENRRIKSGNYRWQSIGGGGYIWDSTFYSEDGDVRFKRHSLCSIHFMYKNRRAAHELNY